MDVIEGAQPIGVQLAAAVGLLTLLLAVMSAVESPMPRQEVAAGTTDAIERALSNEPGLLCSISGMVMNWVTVEAS
jgi:hypothetical protein